MLTPCAPGDSLGPRRSRAVKWLGAHQLRRVPAWGRSGSISSTLELSELKDRPLKSPTRASCDTPFIIRACLWMRIAVAFGGRNMRTDHVKTEVEKEVKLVRHAVPVTQDRLQYCSGLRHHFGRPHLDRKDRMAAAGDCRLQLLPRVLGHGAP